ncbi:uncharacterized protein LOC120354435 [Nilaparvata lugens]|uniref:uncharacterized protein LOC120354435 n=1 Tax=Nilaparvata lugens TaxID=108931 RepID=UPI00193E9C1F|nr:uncharacterized protein LOC120354435 [Nilaparvata lugens]
MSCLKCNSAATPNAADVIKCTKCDSIFHVECTRIRTKGKLAGLGAKKDTWHCDDCNNTTVTVSSADQDSVLQAINSLSTQMNSKLDANFNKITSLESAVIKNTTILNELQSSVNLVKLETENLRGECEGLKQLNDKLSRELYYTKQDLRDLQQYSRINNIEVAGIPVTNNEDVYRIMECVAKALQVTYSGTDISIAHRIPVTKNAKHPSIIACFLSRSTRDSWLSAGRKHRLTAKKVDAALPDGNVFINEHLTPQNKYILS